MKKKLVTMMFAIISALAFAMPVFAEGEVEASIISAKAFAAGAIILVAAAAGAIAMAISVGKAEEGIARQPEAAGNIRTTMMMGLVFIETAIIYALIIAIIVLFVL